MKSFGKRAAALLLSFAMLLGTASAGALGLDSRTAAYLDINNDVHFSLSAQFKSLNPYGEGMLEMFNRTLGHVSVGASITEGGNSTALEICVAGDPVIDLRETVSENGSELTTGLLPNRALVSRTQSAMDAFVGEAQTAEKAFDLFTALEELEGCYQQLTDAIIPYAEEKKANYKIKDVATSKWSRIARLTPEQSAELLPLIAGVLGCGMDEAYRKELSQMTCGKGFIVGLYQTRENGDDMAVYIKGDVTFADGAKRALSYQWAFTEKDGKRTDSFKFMMEKSKAPRDTREITALYKRSLADDKLLLDGSCSAKIIHPETGISVTTTTTHDLAGKERGGARTVEGSVSTAIKTTQGESSKTVTTTVKPDLKLTSSEGSGVLSGTASVEKKTGKLADFSAVITFDEEPAEVFSHAAETGMLYIVTEDMMPPSSLTQNMEEEEEEEEAKDFLVGKPPVGYVSHTSPDKKTAVDLDTLTTEDRALLMDEISQNLAGKLLIALAKLPKEDSVLLQDNMSEEDYAAFLTLIEGL